MIKNSVKILELLGDRLEVCVSVYVYNSEGVDTDKGYKENNFALHVSSICMPCSQCSLHTITSTTHKMYLCN